MITDNLRQVRQNIAEAAKKSGRSLQDITLACVTKEATIQQIREAIGCGVTDIGENRVQDAVVKHSALRGMKGDGRGTIRWHLIGHLQTNKVKKAIEIFGLIHSVDSLRLAQEISRQAAKINKVQDILVQVNTSGEASKFGIKPEETTDLIKQIATLNNIRLLGLMTIAPLVDNPDKSRFCFKKLKLLFDEINIFSLTTYNLRLTTVSMGMSNDYQIAIEEGATMVRIGSAIFK